MDADFFDQEGEIECKCGGGGAKNDDGDGVRGGVIGEGEEEEEKAAGHEDGAGEGGGESSFFAANGNEDALEGGGSKEGNAEGEHARDFDGGEPCVAVDDGNEADRGVEASEKDEGEKDDAAHHL